MQIWRTWWSHTHTQHISPFTNWLCIKWLRLSAAAASAATVYGRARKALGFAYAVKSGHWRNWRICAFCFFFMSLVFSYRLAKQMMMLPCYKFNLFRLRAYFMDLFCTPHFSGHACMRCTLSRTLAPKSFRRLNNKHTILYLFNDNNNNDMYNSDGSIRCTSCAYFLCQKFWNGPFHHLPPSIVRTAIQWKINRMI